MRTSKALRAVTCFVVAATSLSAGSNEPALAQAPPGEEGSFQPHTLDDVTRGPGFGEQHADVLRLYRAFFAREADVDGALFWLGSLDEGQPVASIAEGFATSAEFATTYGDLDDGAFIDTVYRNVLSRRPDADGRAFWIGQLEDGRSRGDVVALIANAVEFESAFPYPASTTTTVDEVVRSPQFGARHAEVLRLYQAFLGRAPDVSGAMFWLGELESGRSVDSIASAFAASSEFEALLASPSDSLFVDLVYTNVLGRGADAEGELFWTDQLAAGRSRASVVRSFATSPEFVAAQPFQMPGVDELLYECGMDIDTGRPRVLDGASLDRLSEQRALQPGDGTFFAKPWLAPIDYVEVGSNSDALAIPPLSIEPPQLGSLFAPACRPMQVQGPPDGGWLDRSLRRQRGPIAVSADTLQCATVDGITGPTVAVLGVAAATTVEVFVNGEYLIERQVSRRSPAEWADIAWNFERGIAISDAVFDLPVSGGPGDSFTVSVIIDGVELPCGDAARLAELPPIQPTWRCSATLDGVLPVLDIDVPYYLTYEVVRDGQLTGLTVSNFFTGIDTDAQPGATHRYELLLRGDGQPGRTMDCGSVAVPADSFANRLAAAEAVFFSLPNGPYLYGSISVISDGTVSGPIDIGMFVSDTPGDSFRSYDIVIVDSDRQPTEVDLPPGHPGIAPIQDVFAELAAALTAGRDVEAEFNERGVPVRWTIDGFGVEFLCFEGDTAPPDLRQTSEPWCVGGGDSFGTLVARS